MSTAALKAELHSNFDEFSLQWRADLNDVANLLSTQKTIFQESYIRIASIQSWRVLVVQDQMDEDSEAFFFEAQNDLLVSHCLAQCGSFRQALKSLRSCIENVFFALFYMDHPIELTQWLQGKHRLTFSAGLTYFQNHPLLSAWGHSNTGLNLLSKEYSTLSKAVHASALQFRMTSDLVDSKLWVADKVAVGQWASREKAVIGSINLLLLHIFTKQLQGAKLRSLREGIGLVIAKTKHLDIKKRLKVTLI
jgi:hypothetical protein